MRTVLLQLALLPLLIPALLAAAVIEGTVKDPSGAATPGAAIILKHSETGQSENTLSDPQGHFKFPDVAPGKYTLTVQHEGFEDAEQAVDVGNAALSLTIALKIGAQQTVVEVAGKRSQFANSDPNYVALRNANPGAQYRVSNLILKRDAATFAFTN